MSVPLRTRVLLADDHPVVRGGLRLILDSEPDLEVTAEVCDGAEAVARAAAGGIDLAILDVTMPRLTGVQAAREIRRRSPAVRLLMLSMHDSEQYWWEARQAGATGYVGKSVADRDLVGACRAVMRGEVVFPAGASALGDARADEGVRAPAELLTPRESEVVKLVAEGYTCREIAALLVITEKTVERHRGNVLDKLGLRDRVDLTRYAIRRGLVEA